VSSGVGDGEIGIGEGGSIAVATRFCWGISVASGRSVSHWVGFSTQNHGEELSKQDLTTGWGNEATTSIGYDASTGVGFPTMTAEANNIAAALIILFFINGILILSQN